MSAQLSLALLSSALALVSILSSRWRSAEGYDEMCGSCDHAKMPVREEGIMKQKEMKTINQEGMTNSVSPALCS